MPSAQREKALTLAASRAAPSPGTRYAWRWQGDVAQLWLMTSTFAGEFGADEVLVAESSLLPPPSSPDVERLVALRRGVEGQVWCDGELKASRWWAEPPPSDAWALFLRSSGLPLPSVVVVPAVVQPVLLGEPWGSAGRRLSWAPAQLEQAFWTSLAAIAALVVGWQLAATVVWGVADAWQDHRLEMLRASAAPLIAARERAEVARTRIDAYASLAATPVDYLLLAELRVLLPADVRVSAWSRDAGQLRVEVEGGGSDPRTFVQSLAGHPVFSSVVANPVTNGRMQLDVALDGDNALSGAAL